MSGITQYPPAGATKSTQRGTTLLTGTTTDVTISAVNTAKSEEVLLGFSVENGGVSDMALSPRISLVGSTTLRLSAFQTTYPVRVSWRVTEKS